MAKKKTAAVVEPIPVEEQTEEEDIFSEYSDEEFEDESEVTEEIEPVEPVAESSEEVLEQSLAKMDEILSKDVALTDDAPFYMPGEWNKHSLALPDNLTFDEWKLTGHTLRRMDASIRWWIGDWLLYGERNFKENFTQEITDVTGLSKKSQQNAMWVSAAIAPERRRADVTWSHHEKVAGMQNTQLADNLLEKAANNEWTVGEFYGVVKAVKEQVNSDKPVDIPVCICHCHHGQCIECGKPIGAL